MAIISKYTCNNKGQPTVFQANWLNVLPDIENMDVLKVGTTKRDNIITITSLNPNSLCCIGYPIVDLVGIVKKYYNSINDVPSEAYDLIIFDESEYILSIKSFKEIKEMLLKISQILKDNGTLLICFPDGWFSVKYRYWVKKALYSTKLNEGKYFLCDPSSEYPFVIVPYSENQRWLISRLQNIKERSHSIKGRLKDEIKKVVFNVTKIYCPFRGLILVTDKSLSDELRNKYILNEIMKILIVKDELIKNVKPMMICITATYMVKYHLFIYNMLTCDLFVIVKAGIKSYRHVYDVRVEYENMVILSKCKKLFDEKNIKISDPIHSGVLSGKDITIQSAIQGTSVDWLIEKYTKKNNRKAILKILDELTDIQIYVQDVCSKNIINSVSIIKDDYFDNYMDISYDWEKQEHALYLNHVQHGDFTTENVLFDEDTNNWGLIDWEWMNKGFPLLFDLFSLFTSCRFVKKYAYNDLFDKYYHSFIHTYFSKNWFSEHLEKLVEKYCAHFNLGKEHIYYCFIAYLLFFCNKFRSQSNAPAKRYLKLNEKMLIYAVNNKKRFIFK